MAALVLGAVLILAAIMVDLNRSWIIRNVTSRPLGSLAPGYAATDAGMKVYARVLSAAGLLVNAVWVSTWSLWFAAGLTVAGALAFVVFSVIAIRGEVRTYRALKR